MDGFTVGIERESVLHTSLGGLVHALDWVAAVIALFAIAVILVGTLRFAVVFVQAEFARADGARTRLMNAERVELGRYILAGLELFIVSDLIHAALSLSLTSLLFLGLLVLIRSAISFFLDREMAEARRELGK